MLGLLVALATVAAGIVLVNGRPLTLEDCKPTFIVSKSLTGCAPFPYFMRLSKPAH